MASKGLLALDMILALAPSCTRQPPPSSTCTYVPASHDRDAAPIKYALLPTPAGTAEPGSTRYFPELFRPVERANVRNRGREPARLDLLRRDDNGDGCDLCLAPPLQKIPAQERYLETKKQRKRSFRVEPYQGQEIKKRKVTAKAKVIKNIKKSKPQNGGRTEAISVSSSSPSSAALSL